MSKFAALALEVDAPARMVIKHPISGLPIRDADGNEAWIDLYSSDSEAARKAQRTITNGRLAMRNRNAIDAKRLETEGTEMLADLTAGWNLLSLDGQKIDVPFSRANAIELYSERSLAWVREQADAFVGDRANFGKASSTS
jgi:hypothetical protein